jgi:predicted nucleic acid-binding protein
MRAILDSGPLVALWREGEKHAIWAEKIFQEYAGPFYVTEPILTEIAHLTAMDKQIIAGLKTGRFILDSTMLDDLSTIERCCVKYPHCDLADASVVALSERHPTLKVITTDRRHFVTYRRNDRSALPLILPT